MTLQNRYNDLTTPLTLFNKEYPAVITAPLTVDKLKTYAANCINSNIPALVSIGFEVNRNIFTSGNNLNNNI